jgi:hypothetical protein
MNGVIYDVYWEGPFTLAEITTKNDVINKSHCLYQVYGDHPCYGHDVLLYIGQTRKGIVQRFAQHNRCFSEECEEVKVFVGSCGVFTNWVKWGETPEYGVIDSTLLNAIESLLIYAHQPAYNSREKCQPIFSGYNFRIFNTYRRKALMPEISTLFYRDDVNSVECDNQPAGH